MRILFFSLLDIGFFPCSTHTLPSGSVCLLQIKLCLSETDIETLDHDILKYDSI